MKLNKKGFSMAQVAIVIVVIAILATVIIAGVMGITKTAEDNVESQQEIAETMLNDIKHAFPTVLSGDQVCLEIKNGEYEVYELGGYKLHDGSTGKNPLYVEEGGTLFLSGNGTLDDQCKVAVKDTGTASAVVNYGNLTLSDLIISGGNKSNNNARYQFSAYTNSITTLNNVKMVGTNGGMYLVDATLYINGTNSNISMPSGTSRSGQNLFYIALTSKVEINDGTFTISDQHNQFFGFAGGTLTINGGHFTDNFTGGANNQIFYFSSYRVDENTLLTPTVEINGGVFDCTVCSCSQCKNNTERTFFYFYGSSSATITGGEFIKAPPRFATGVNQTNRKMVIKDAPNDGTEQLIFHYAPNVGSDGGWGQYVAEGYEWYEIEAGTLWGVRPTTTPSN